MGEVALGLEVVGVCGGEGAAEGEGPLEVGGGVGGVLGAVEAGYGFEDEGEVPLEEGGWRRFVILLRHAEGGFEVGGGLGVEAKLGFDGAELGGGLGEEAGDGGVGGEVVGLAREREGLMVTACGGEGSGEVLVVFGAGCGCGAGGVVELARGGVVFAGALRFAGGGFEVGESCECGSEVQGAGLG